MRKSSIEKHFFEMELNRDRAMFPPAPAMVNLVSIQVGFLMCEVLKIVTGILPPSVAGKLVQLDFKTMMTSVTEEWERLLDCPVCS